MHFVQGRGMISKVRRLWRKEIGTCFVRLHLLQYKWLEMKFHMYLHRIAILIAVWLGQVRLLRTEPSRSPERSNLT